MFHPLYWRRHICRFISGHRLHAVDRNGRRKVSSFLIFDTLLKLYFIDLLYPLVFLISQSVTSDVTVSMFTGDKFIVPIGHPSNTYGIGGESSRAPDSNGAGLQHGTVVYPDGILKVTVNAPGSEGTSEVPYHRLIIYHTFYKVQSTLAACCMHCSKLFLPGLLIAC